MQQFFKDTVIQIVKNQRVFLTIALGLWIIFNFWGLEKYIVPSCDEAHYSAVAYSFLTTGKFGMPIMENIVGVETSYIPYGRLLMIGQASIQFLFGPTLFSARIFSLIGLFCLVIMTYKLSTLLFDHQIGLWATILMIVQWPIFMQSHSGRPEMWAIAASLTSLYVVLSLNDQHPKWVYFGAGFLTTLPLDIHLNEIHFGLATGIIAMYTLLWEKRKIRLFSLYTTGCLAGLLYFIVVHLFPDPALAINQYQTLIRGEGRDLLVKASILTNFIDLGQWVYRSYITSFTGGGFITTLFYIAGITMSLVLSEKKRGIYILLAFIAISISSFTIVNVYKPNYYAVLWCPVLTILGTKGIIELARSSSLSKATLKLSVIMSYGLLSILLVLMISGDIYLTFKYRETNYAAYVKSLQSFMLPDKKVFADDLLWYGLHEQHMISTTYIEWANYIKHRRVTPDSIPEIFYQVAPDYVILDNTFGCHDDSNTILDNIVTKTCVPIGKATDVWLGKSTVYSCPRASSDSP